jgi:putative FmdB family regulatory protein
LDLKIDMPTYEFLCPEGHDFEKFFRTMGAAPSQLECPVCGAVGERKVSGGSGLVFKGSGFYITDYGKDGKKDLREREKSARKASNDSSSSKSDSSSKSAGE